MIYRLRLNLGSTNKKTNAIPSQPLPSSMDLNFINLTATSTKICTKVKSNLNHFKSSTSTLQFPTKTIIFINRFVQDR